MHDRLNVKNAFAISQFKMTSYLVLDKHMYDVYDVRNQQDATTFSIVYISPTHALYIKTLHKHTKIVN
jgi:hypothetical protein